MRIRYMFITVIINIFALLFVSLLQEYADIQRTFQRMSRTINTSVETAVDMTMASEEFFTPEFADYVLSNTQSTHDAVLSQHSQVRLFRNGDWITGSSFLMGWFYDTAGKDAASIDSHSYQYRGRGFMHGAATFPTTQEEYNTFVDSWYVRQAALALNMSVDDFNLAGHIFRWLYMDLDTTWFQTYIRMPMTYSWLSGGANTSFMATTLGDDRARRTPNEEFLEFFNSVGKDMQEYAFVMRQDPTTGDIDMKQEYVPILCRMGLRLQTDNTETGVNGVNDSMYNYVTGSSVNYTMDGGNERYTAPEYVSVKKYGRGTTSDDTVSGNGRYGYDTGAGYGYTRSIYFYTPYSLGVTYIPQKLLKSNILINLENSIRMSKCKITPLGDNIDDIYEAYASADGCIGTSVYEEDAAGDISDTSNEHITHSTYIMNDGLVEYNMDTLQTKIDYFTVDFFDDNNADIVVALTGNTPQQWRDNDTSNAGSLGSDYLGLHVVAQVTVKMKVNVPYQSPILQWFVQRSIDPTATEEHYGIARWDDGAGRIVTDEDGLWYAYTTYATVLR